MARIVAGFALAVSPAVWSADPAPLPYDLRVEVVEGTRRAPTSLRNEIAAAAHLEFVRKGCFRKVQTGSEASAGDALRLRLIVDDYQEETRWDIGLVDRAQPQGGHDTALDSRVVLDVAIQVELRPGADQPPVRSKTFRSHVSRSPESPEEDAATDLRQALVARIAEDARKFVCEGSRRKLLRDLERARATPAVPPDR